MPFRGPSRAYGLGPGGDYELERQAKNDEFAHALELASQGQSVSRDWGNAVARNEANQTAMDAGRARLAMTPGVSRGGSTATHSVADSPLMQGSSSEFSQFGENYSYDPIVAAEQEGRSSGTATATAEQTRYDALQKIPGVKPRDAAKIVYGLTQPDPNDPMHTALATYLRTPTRETAAAAVQLGASLNQFPDRFGRIKQDAMGGELPERPVAPVFGSSEYFDAIQKEEDIRVAGEERKIKLRAAESPANSPETAARRAAQQTRLQLDEARKDIPRPSKVPSLITQKDAQGQVHLVPNPDRAKAVSDSIAYEANTLAPLRSRFTTVTQGPLAPATGSANASSRSSWMSTPAPANPNPPAAPAPKPSPVAQATSALHNTAQAQADAAIAKIQASSLSAEDKAARVAAVKARLSTLLRP